MITGKSVRQSADCGHENSKAASQDEAVAVTIKSPLLDEFRASLSERTGEIYHGALTRAARAAVDKLSLPESQVVTLLTTADSLAIETAVRAYLKNLGESRSVSTVNGTRAALNAYYRWAVRKRKRVDNPIVHVERLPADCPDPDWYTIEQMRLLCEAPGKYARTERDRWFDECILRILCSVGLRAGELRTMRLENLDRETGRIKVLGKGQKYRWVKLPDRVMHAVRMHLRTTARKRADHGPVLMNPRAGMDARLPWVTIRRIIYKYGKALRVDGYDVPDAGAHAFRRGVFTALFDAGATPIDVCRLAGHSSLDTTLKYDRRKASDLSIDL